MIFSSRLPFTFGGWVPQVREIDGTDLAWIESHCDEGKKLLLSQFRNKPRIEAVLCALLDGVQDAEDALWQVLTERWIDTAIGAQLDRLGSIVKLPRAGWADDVYRVLIKAQVLVLRSGASWAELFDIMIAMGFDPALIVAGNSYPAGIDIDAGQVPPINAIDVFHFLDRARGAAIRLVFTYPTRDVEDMFTWSSAARVADSRRGWGDRVRGGIGGYLSSAFASSPNE